MKNLFVYSEECIGQKVLQYLEPLADGLESITVITGETEVELEVIQWAKENCIRISRSHTFIFNRVKNHRDNLREVIQNILSIKACLLFFRQFTSKVASLIKIAEKYGLKTFTLVSDPYHLKRASVIAEFYGMTVYPSATPTTRFKGSEKKLEFLIRESYYLILYKIGIALM